MRAAANAATTTDPDDDNDNGDDNARMVKFYAVSCTVYQRICRHYKVTRFPTVRLFPARPGNNNESQYIPVNYGRLQPFDILLKLGVQSASSSGGGGQLSGEITSNTALRQQVLPPPIARLAVGGGSSSAGEMTAVGTEASSSAALLTAAFDRQVVKKKDMYTDMYRSLHFSLQYEVYASNEPLSPDARNALLQWLRLLQTTLPPVWSEVHNLLNALIGDFDAIVQGQEHLAQVLDQFPPPINNMKWSEDCSSHGGANKGMGFTCGLWKLFHLMTVGIVEWNNNSQQQLLPVNAHNKHSGSSSSSSSSMKILPSQAATILRNYIQHFFRCEVCRTEFVQTFDSCQQNHCHALFIASSSSSSSSTTSLTMADWIQLPIWLFETHNAVTRRLLHETAENDDKDKKQPHVVSRQEELDHEWPSRADCPTCWRVTTGADEAGSSTSMSLFDRDHVYTFLRLEYWPEDGVAAEYRSQSSGVASSPQSLGKNEGTINNDTTRFSLWLSVCLSILLAMAWYSKMTVSRKKVKH
jgi:uncharacterized protein YbdZ (MbtH family)